MATETCNMCGWVFLDDDRSHWESCPRTESEEDYVRACDAQHAANPHRFEGEL